ncbi:MAG: DUF1648 domain-containing protein [Opitutaceae bacterium]
MKRILRAIFLLLMLAAWGQAGWQHSHLPERVAAHFNGIGQPNGWVSRDALLGWQIGAMAFLAALFCGIAYLQPCLPTDFINLPHRDYWLASERRAATDAWIAGLIFAVGSLVVAFLMFVFHLVYRVNLTPEP